MALGALAAVAVIVVAATQLPRWQKTHAGEATAPATQQAPAQTQPPAAQVQPATQPPTGQESPAARPPAEPPAVRAESKPAARPPRTQPQAPAQPAGRAATSPAETPQPPPPSERAQPAPAQPSVSPEAQAALSADLLKVREQAISLAARADALHSSLKNLQDQQQRAGLSMRTDIATSWKRMDYFLDEAEAALKARDLAGAKRAVSLAEREADRLDQFLGH
jgi:hypothetical protein